MLEKQLKIKRFILLICLNIRRRIIIEINNRKLDLVDERAG